MQTGSRQEEEKRLDLELKICELGGSCKDFKNQRMASLGFLSVISDKTVNDLHASH